MFKAATEMRTKFPFEAPEVSKNIFPKNPAVGGIPASENNAIAMVQASAGFVLTSPLYCEIVSLPVCSLIREITAKAARLEKT